MKVFSSSITHQGYIVLLPDVQAKCQFTIFAVSIVLSLQHGD